MKIDIEKYLMNYIGDISWYGETNHDKESEDNMNKAKEVLYFLETIKDDIVKELNKHQSYRTGNASAIMLHKKAKELCIRFDDYHLSHELQKDLIDLDILYKDVIKAFEEFREDYEEDS